MSIENLIHRDVHTIHSDQSCVEGAALMDKENVGCLVVTTEEDIPIGIITDRDLTLRILAAQGDPDQPIENVMTSDPIFLSESASLDEVISNMRDLRFRRMIVVDDDKRLCGIVTLDDLVMYMGDTLAHLAEAIRNELRR